MNWFIAVIAGAAAFIFYRFYSRYQSKKERRRKLAESWGKPKERKHKWARIRYYFDLSQKQENTAVIDDDTWNDLNFNEIFQLADHTQSSVGQQILYDVFRRPALKKNILARRAQWMQLFTDKKEFRIDLQTQLQKLNGFGMWRLTHLFFEKLPDVPQWFYILLCIPAVVISFIVIGFFKPVFFLLLAFLLVTNVFIQYFGEDQIMRHTSALGGLSVFLSAVEEINDIDKKYDNPLGEAGKQMDRNYQSVHNLKKKVSTILDEGSTNEMVYFFVEFLNLLFLAKINMFTLSVRSINQNQKKLQKLYHTIGFMDAMISAASFKAGLNRCCQPDFIDAGKKLRYQGMVHPLLENPVPNSVEVARKGILVTGSNMSGKSTFLKTMGVNQVLAQTVNYCCAEEAELLFCGVISSMRREDDITEGESFYLGEVRRVKKLIESAADTNFSNLFLLDEIFRGTNTIERISSSLEVLRWLNRADNFVLASTHDLELVDLLDQEYIFYHFSETITDNEMTFDYKLKPGQSSTKNAIRLLGINGYPQEVVQRALDVSQELEQQGVINYHQGSVEQ